MNQKPVISIEISMDYINWMLSNPEMLNDTEKEWVAEFTRLFNERLNNKPAAPKETLIQP